MTPWLEQLLANFRSASAAAMRLAAEDVAVKNGVADAITTFGDAAKAVAVHAAGTSTPAKAWASFRTAVEHAMHAATNLEAEWISRAEPDARTVKNNLRRVRELAREVARYAAQLPDARQAGELLATQSIISSRGLYVLHLSYFPLHVLSEDDRAEMRDAGRTLHLFETRTIYGPRVESLDDIAREVMRESNRLQGLTERLASL